MMDDAQAELVLREVLDLAVRLRDEGGPVIEQAARQVLAAAGGDPVAALVVAAALIRVEAPVDPWWQRPAGLPAIGVQEPTQGDDAADAPGGLDEVLVERLMTGQTRLSPWAKDPEIVEALRRLLEQGASCKDAGELLGRSRSWASKAAAAHGIRPARWDETAPCGTHAAHNRHVSRGEPVDSACATAERVYQAQRTQVAS